MEGKGYFPEQSGREYDTRQQTLPLMDHRKRWPSYNGFIV